LSVSTILNEIKKTVRSKASAGSKNGFLSQFRNTVTGYEIHMGATKIIDGTPLLEINSRNSLSCTDSDGCLADNNQVAGTYIHGFFDSSQVLSKWLGWAGITIKNSFEDMNSTKEKDYTLLKEHFENYIDIAPLL
jgi:adenosylcobyric acid synthase